MEAISADVDCWRRRDAPFRCHRTPSAVGVERQGFYFDPEVDSLRCFWSNGLSVIFQTLDLVQELSGQRGERAQREFLQCRRAAHESLDSFLMRVEAQRDLMLEEDSEFAMGERFLVGYVLDNAELTQRDRVLVMAAAGNRLSSDAVYPALRRMGPFLQGTVPIGRGLSDRPLLPELLPDAPSSSVSGNQHGGGQWLFWQQSFLWHSRG